MAIRGASAGDDLAAGGDDALVEPGAQALRFLVPAVIGLGGGGEAHDRGHGGGAGADSRPPGRRSPRASPVSLTSSAPMPGGPPNLWAATTMKSASGSGSLPALCAQSARSRPPAALTRAATSAIGWMTPVSLLTDWTATSGALRAVQRARRDRRGRACRRHGPRSGARRARCAAPPDARPPRRSASFALARSKTSEIASVAPEVKMRVPSQPSAAAIRRRASSSCARTARPSAWGEEGLAQLRQRLGHRRRRLGQDRRGRGMVEIDAVGHVFPFKLHGGRARPI